MGERIFLILAALVSAASGSAVVLLFMAQGSIRLAAASLAVAPFVQAVADATFDDLAKRLSGREPAVGLEARTAELLDDHLDFALGQPKLYDFLFTELRDGARRWPDDFRDGGSPTLSPVAEALRDGLGPHANPDDIWDL